MKWLKWGGIAVVSLVVLGVAAGGGAAWWYVESIRGHMAPPAPQDGDVSILEYASTADPAGPAEPALVETGQANWSRLHTPPLSARPWVRWWWPGAAVNPALACGQLEDLKDAGFAAVEIQPFSAGLDVVDSEAVQETIHRVGGEAYNDILADVMVCADRLGVDVWLNHFSGWPAGGPQVLIEDGLQELQFAEFSVRGGRTITRALPRPLPGFNDFIMALGESQVGFDLTNFAGSQGRLVSVVAAKTLAGERSANPLNANDTVRLDPESVIVLTDRVSNGELEWDAPPGDWLIIASYVSPSGEAPTLTAFGRDGFVIDHLRADRVRAHYDFGFGARTGLAPYYGDPLQGFFNDSLEFKVSRLSTEDILATFRERRGYDLEPWLPVIFRDAFDNYFIREVGRILAAPAFEMTGEDDRIRHDYQLTLSDLIIERFIEESAQWAARRGLLSRGQSYGLDIDVIRALGANDVPETEQLFAGGSPLFLKMAGAAGALYDRPRVSAEAFVWADQAYAVTPRQIRAAADALFLSGVNTVLYHGIAYASDQPEFEATFGELGWYPFFGPENFSNFSNDYGPGSSVWPALPTLNAYLARTQSLLQTGEPSVDVWIYYPFLGFPTTIEDAAFARDSFLFMGTMPGETPPPASSRYEIPFVSLPEAEIDPRVAWLEELEPVLTALDEAGITWSWVNDHALQSGAFARRTEGGVVLANLPWLPLETLDALESLEAGGRPVGLVGSPPEAVAGFDPDGEADDALQRRLEAFAPRLLSGAEVAERVRPRVTYAEAGSVRRVSRRIEDGYLHFFVNQSGEATETRLNLTGLDEGASLSWFDPLSGRAWPADDIEGSTLPLMLSGLESRFLVVGPSLENSDSAPVSARVSDFQTRLLPSTDWTIRVEDSSRALGETFIDWRADPALMHVDSPVIYSTVIELEADAAARVRALDLGRVEGQAMVRIDGGPSRRLALDPFLLELPDGLEAGPVRIDIEIVPPRRNALAGRGVNGGDGDAFLAPLNEALAPAGLLGPVRLLSIEEQGEER